MKKVRERVRREAQREDPAHEDELGRQEDPQARVQGFVLPVQAVWREDDRRLQLLVLEVVRDCVGYLVIVHLVFFFLEEKTRIKTKCFSFKFHLSPSASFAP